MAVKVRQPDKKVAPSLLLRVRAAGKVLEETLLHPTKTSRIVMDAEKNTVTVTRNGHGASS